jgi:hypothetical protein
MSGGCCGAGRRAGFQPNKSIQDPGDHGSRQAKYYLPNCYPETPALCAALLCVNTFSHPSPISDLNASIRARNASPSLISTSFPSSVSTSSGFVIGVSNTDAATRPRRAVDRRDDTLTLIVRSDGE